jgi:short-subunit dehydrogenase
MPARAAGELAAGAGARRREGVRVSKTALITGASGGIGYELALLFARDGYDCILVARSQDKLKELASRLEREHHVKTLVIGKDLSKPSAVDEIYEETTAAGLVVDALVNNAGFPVFGLFNETDLQAELEMLQVNVIALTALTKLFLKPMVERRSGRILNLASTAAFLPGPLMAVYYASKAYVLSFSQALANEVQGTGVTVTALAPGPTRTGFQKRGAMEDSRLVQGQIADAASVALAGYRGLMAGKTLVIPGFANKLIPWVGRLSPRGMVTRVVRRLQERVPQH